MYQLKYKSGLLYADISLVHESKSIHVDDAMYIRNRVL